MSSGERSAWRELLLLVALMLLGCSGPTPEELASLAAKGYYDHLTRGEYDLFLEGKTNIEQMPADYQSQLQDACRQYMAEQEVVHRGVREVRISNAVTDTLQHYTNVFLVLCFGDSTNEEVVVPMVEQEGRWRLK